MAKQQPSWVKVDTRMYDNSKVKQIDSMKNNNLIHYIWICLILLAGRCNCDGELYLTDDMPYTIKTFAIEFRRTEGEIKEAFKVLRKLKMIELTEDKVFYLPGWSEYQSVDGLEKIRKQTNERVARFREKKREEKKAAEESKKSEDNNAGKNDDKQNEDYSAGENDMSNVENDINENEDIILDAIKQDSNSENGDKCNDDTGSISEDNVNENSIEEQLDKGISDKTELNKNDNTIEENLTKNNTVTCNEVKGVTDDKKKRSETQQNKKENKNKNKKRREKENKAKTEDNTKNISLSNSENMYTKAIELSQYCEKVTGKVGLLDISGLNMAIDMHGSNNVKKAIQKAIEQKKVSMTYICGILRNWGNEGYPKDDGIGEDNINYSGGKDYGGKCNKKGVGSDTEEFDSFKPKEPRKLSEEERNRVCANVV